MILTRKFNGDAHQIQRKHAHPTRAVTLFKMAAVAERGAAVEYANVIESEKSALENIIPFEIFAIHPPGKGD